MKILKSICLLATVFMLSTHFAAGQFIKKIQKAASRGVERAIEEKVEEETNKYVQRQLEKQLAGLYSEDNESAPITLDMNKILAGIGTNVPTADRYEFTGTSTFEVISTDERGKQEEPMELVAYLSQSPQTQAMQIEDKENNNGMITMIFDLENNASILLMENSGEKSSFAYALDMDALMANSDEMIAAEYEDAEFSIEKTGNTKQILGYTCEEYAVKSKDGEGTYWVTQEPIEGFASFWSENSPFVTTKTQKTYAEHFQNMPEGNFMEMHFNSTDGSQVSMKVTDLQVNSPATFVMSEYPNLMTQSQEN
ncbi:DUF4412 domain-containing protein [Algoriphagus namhaensis]